MSQDLPISKPVVRIKPKLSERPLRDMPSDALTYFIQYLEATRRKHLSRLPVRQGAEVDALIQLAHDERRARVLRESA